MSSLISAAIRSKIDEVSLKLHDTFAVAIVAYKNAEKVCLVSSAQFNSLYGNSGETQPLEFVEISTTIMARVYFLNNDKTFFDGAYGTQNKIVLPNGSIKIVVDASGFAFLKGAKQVTFNAVDYSIESGGAHANSTGMFDSTFYAFFLIPINE